jgi:hypothetical protein
MDLKHDAITLDLALPNSAFTSSLEGTKSLHHVVLHHLAPFDLASLNISFRDDDAYVPRTPLFDYLSATRQGSVLPYIFPMSYRHPHAQFQKICLELNSGLRANPVYWRPMWNDVYRMFLGTRYYVFEFEWSDGQKGKRIPHRWLRREIGLSARSVGMSQCRSWGRLTTKRQFEASRRGNGNGM